MFSDKVLKMVKNWLALDGGHPNHLSILCCFLYCSEQHSAIVLLGNQRLSLATPSILGGVEFTLHPVWMVSLEMLSSTKIPGRTTKERTSTVRKKLREMLHLRNLK